jgi:hypothetical protein
LGYSPKLPFSSKTKIKKRYIQKKSKNNNSSEKRRPEHLKSSYKLVEEVKKIQRLKFNNIFLTDKEPC